jgi:hypothetical protein
VKVEGDLMGQVAGGDIHNHGPVVFHLPPMTESELQARFYKNTGISCNREVRDIFENLMLNHGFCAKELRSTWGDTIKWDIEAKALSFCISFYKRAAASLLLFAVILQCVGFGMEMAIRPPLFGWSYAVGTSVIVGYFAFAFFYWHSTVSPMKVAARARAALTAGVNA